MTRTRFTEIFEELEGKKAETTNEQPSLVEKLKIARQRAIQETNSTSAGEAARIARFGTYGDVEVTRVAPGNNLGNAKADFYRDPEAAPTGPVYFLAGSYFVQITECRLLTTRNGVPMFIINAAIVLSDNPLRPPGCLCSQVIRLATPGSGQALAPPGLADVKSFLVAMGLDGSADVGKEVVSERQPLKGRTAKLDVIEMETRSGNRFLKHRWSRGE